MTVREQIEHLRLAKSRLVLVRGKERVDDDRIDATLGQINAVLLALNADVAHDTIRARELRG